MGSSLGAGQACGDRKPKRGGERKGKGLKTTTFLRDDRDVGLSQSLLRRRKRKSFCQRGRNIR